MLTPKLYYVYIFDRRMQKYMPINGYISGFPIFPRSVIENSRNISGPRACNWIAIPCSQHEL